VLITGAPASGKSELAGRLAARYRAVCCSKDSIKEILLDTLGSGDAGWSRRLSNASFSVLFEFAPLLCRAERPLLLEGNFRPGEHERPLAALLSAAGAQLAQVLCMATHATRAGRLAARAHDPRRHPGHHDAHPGTQPAAQVRCAADAGSEAGFLQLSGPRLAFDSDAPRAPQLAILYTRLDAWGLACINIDPPPATHASIER
jgi:predicted kinase